MNHSITVKKVMIQVSTLFVMLMLLSQAVLAGGHTGGSGKAEKIDRQLDVPKDAVIHIRNTAGEISISGRKGDGMHITGRLSRHALGLETEVKGRNVDIYVKLPPNAKDANGTELHFDVPEGASIYVNTVSADIEARDLKGKVHLESVSGDIEMSGQLTKLFAKTVSGDLEFAGKAPDAQLMTVSGDLEGTGLSGDIRVETVSGDVQLEASDIGNAHFESVSGELVLRMKADNNAKVYAKSMSGDIVIALAKGSSTRIEAETFSGRLRHGDKPVQAPKYGNGKSLESEVGSGSARISAKTFSGDVVVNEND